MRALTVALTLALALTSALILAPITPIRAESELIDPSRLTGGQSYSTVSVESGELTVPVSMGANPIFPRSRPAVYEGPEAEHLETLVKVGDEVKAGDPVERIRVLTDGISLEEQRLRLRDLRESRDTQLTEMDAALATMDAAMALITDPADIEIARLERQEKAIQRQILESRMNHQIRQLSAAIAELEAAGEIQYVTAPIDGVVRDLTQYRTGDRIYSGAIVCQITDPSVILLRTEAGGLRYGQSVGIETGRGNVRHTLTGTVVASENTDPALYRETALVAIPEDEETFSTLSDREFRWMSTRVDGVKLHYENVPVVTRDAVTSESGMNYVSFLSEEGGRSNRTVLIGSQDREKIWILLGAEEGDQLILR